MTPRKYRALLILGAAVWPGGVPSTTLARRVNFAAKIFNAGGYDLVIPSGGLGDHPPTEAAVMRGLLAASGVPGEKIILDEDAKSTMDTAQFARRWQAAHADTAIVAVTDAYHKPRTALALWACGVDASVIPVPNATPRSSASQILKMWAREALALPYYLARAAAIKVRGRA
jgi:uncharacterized SAM-binding protein YcdF (DUF218 family)